MGGVLLLLSLSLSLPYMLIYTYNVKYNTKWRKCCKKEGKGREGNMDGVGGVICLSKVKKRQLIKEKGRRVEWLLFGGDEFGN